MNITQQNALIYLSETNYELIQKYRFNSIFGKLESEEYNLLEKYKEALTDAFTVFKCELETLRPNEIMECLENSLSENVFNHNHSDQTVTKRAGKLQKYVNSALKKLKNDKPDFIFYPAHSKVGLIPKGELTVIEIINPTDSPEYIKFQPKYTIENCLVKINNYHSFNKSKFISWSEDIRELFKGIIRLFSVLCGHTDVRHVLFFYQHETSSGWNNRSYISRNGVLGNFESFDSVAPERKDFFENIKSGNLVTVINSLTTQEFLDNTLAKNVQFALSRFNRAIESHDNCEAIVNLCTSLEAIANQLYRTNICKECESKQVSKGLKEFLNERAFNKHINLYPKEINPTEEFRDIYTLRSKITHGSIEKKHTEILKNYMPKAIKFVGITLYILILNACTTGFNLPLNKINSQ